MRSRNSISSPLTSLLGAAALSAPLLGAPAAAWAQEPAPAAAPAPSEAPSLPDGPADAAEEEAAADPLRERLDALTAEVERMKEVERTRESGLTFSGYIDLGFFAPVGNNGVGWIRDAGNLQLPKYAGYSWVFLGDLLATPVNTRGEPADMGDAPGIGPGTGLDRFDSVDSNGAASFIANEVNLRPSYQVTDRATARASINFVPRSGRDFRLGDFMDVDLAELEWVLTDDGNTSVFVGKTLPVFGIEYKERKSDQRFGITPSLIARYTMGPQLGLKFRSKLLNEVLIVAGSVTNNSSVIEPFHFQREIDSNNGKTLNGRLALSIPLGRLANALEGNKLEIGGSGEYGPQDWATDNAGKTWFIGVDLQYLSPSFSLKAQGIRGRSDGDEEQNVWRLRLRNSGYAEINVLPVSWFGILARAEARDAIVKLGHDRVYITKEARFTGGLRFVFSPRAALKLEYLHNREWGMQQFKNDMFTSSLVLSF